MNFEAYVTYSERRKLPEQAGLYALVYYGECPITLYVGSSTNLKRRWRSHHVMQYLNECSHDQLKIEYSLVPCADKAQVKKLRQWEQSAIKSSEPLLNIACTAQKRGAKWRERRQRFSIRLLGDALRADLIRGYRHAAKRGSLTPVMQRGV